MAIRIVGSRSVRNALLRVAPALLTGSGILLAAAGASAADGPAPAPESGRPAEPALDKAAMDAGRELFASWSCGSCHALHDAGGEGHVGPSFDGNSGLSRAFIIDRVTNGQGAMPSFGGQLTDAEIARLADYIMAAAAK